MTKYSSHVSSRKTAQSEQVPGKNQVKNSAGGFVFSVDCWTRLDRWLILGSEGNTYYATEKKLTKENAQSIIECMNENGPRTVARIVEISEAGRAPKNDPAIFALAMCAGLGNVQTKEAALAAMPKVCRIGTHLFQFAEDVQAFRGWGRGLRRAIANWYTSKDVDNLAYQLVKYQQRNGWSHRDLLRLARVHENTPIYRWATGRSLEARDVVRYKSGTKEVLRTDHYSAVEGTYPKIIVAFEEAKHQTNPKEICRLIREYNLPRECVPTVLLKEPEVWEALLEKMPMTALIRNLATMTRIGLLKPLSKSLEKVQEKLSNQDYLRKDRIHPVAVLNALLTYSMGRSVKGDSWWTPVAQVVDALDEAFYKTFGNIESTGKRMMLALDLSGSMAFGVIAGISGLTPRVGAAAMSLITAATEPNHLIVGFTAEGSNPITYPGTSRERLSLAVSTLTISPRQRLDDVVKYTNQYSERTQYGGPYRFGGTDCSLPMRYAMDQSLEVDTFVIYTDSETWAGNIHPYQALQQYRNKTGIPAKLVIVGMVSNGFTLADPSDSGMLDCVGFDTATPQLISDFSAN